MSLAVGNVGRSLEKLRGPPGRLWKKPQNRINQGSIRRSLNLVRSSLTPGQAHRLGFSSLHAGTVTNFAVRTRSQAAPVIVAHKFTRARPSNLAFPTFPTVFA